MKTRVLPLILCATVASSAALFAADSFRTGQFTPSNGYTPNLTLLTGPHYLSPASSAAHPTQYGNWRFVPAGQAAPSNAEIEDARAKLADAEERLKALEAKRAAALALQSAGGKNKEGSPRLFLKAAQDPSKLPSDMLHFDAKLPDVPTSLVRKPELAQGTLRFEPAAK